jgi:hypothetical protein
LIDKVKQRIILFKNKISILYKLEPLDKVSLVSTLENFIASLIFGAVIAIAYVALSKKIVD